MSAIVAIAARRRAWTAAAVTFVLLGVGLTVAQRVPKTLLPPRVAVEAALHDEQSRTELTGVHWTSTQVTPLDGSLTRVDFYDGSQIAAEFAIDRRRAVTQRYVFAGQAVPYGDWIAYEPAVLLGLSVLFVLMTAVAPLRRLRNLDVLAMLSMVAPVVLFQHRYVAGSVLAALPGLAYLLGRTSWIGLASHGTEPLPATPLIEVITSGLSGRDRRRMLRFLLLAVALVFVMVGVSSPRAVDVLYAVMEGATRIAHGVLPYGHMPGDVVHGDTYPILSYLLYVPLAMAAPVTSTWDSVDVGLGLAVLAALVAAGVASVLARRARGARLAPGGTAGLRAAISVLSFPPLLVAVSSGTSDVLMAAMLGLAVLLWRRPTVSVGMLAAAGWFKLAPFALLPLWLAPLRGRRLAAALAALIAVSAAMLAVVIWLGGVSGLGAMVRGIGYQASRGSPQSLWAALGIGTLQPLGEAGVAALIVGAAVVQGRDPQEASQSYRVAALSAAILIAAQLTTSYWTFLYTVWAVPLLGGCLFAEPAAPAAVPEHSSSRLRLGRVGAVTS